LQISGLAAAHHFYRPAPPPLLAGRGFAPGHGGYLLLPFYGFYRIYPGSLKRRRLCLPSCLPPARVTFCFCWCYDLHRFAGAAPHRKARHRLCSCVVSPKRHFIGKEMTRERCAPSLLFNAISLSRLTLVLQALACLPVLGASASGTAPPSACF